MLGDVVGEERLPLSGDWRNDRKRSARSACR
jgi:hypothetical protein